MTPEHDSPQGVDVTEILERNARRFGVTAEQLTGRRRFRSIARARSTSQLEIREEKGLSFSKIGKIFDSHRTTIMSNVRRARGARESNDWAFISEDAVAEVSAIPTQDSEEEYMQGYLEKNFPGVSLSDIRENPGKKLARRIYVPQEALIKHLFNDRGIYVNDIARQLKRNDKSIVHVLGKSDEQIRLEVEAWKHPSKKDQERAKKALMRQEARQQLENELRIESEMVPIIFTVIADVYGVGEEEIISSTRRKHIAWPRHLIAYSLRMHTDLHLVKIAELLNRENHTTIINSIMRVETQVELDEEIKEEVEQVEKDILDLAEASSQPIANQFRESAAIAVWPLA